MLDSNKFSDDAKYLFLDLTYSGGKGTYSWRVKYFENIDEPNWWGSVVEQRPINQKVMV